MNLHLTKHARERLAEMELQTEVVWDILRFPSITRPAGNRGVDDQHIAVSDKHPDYAVVYHRNAAGGFVVHSVVFRTYEDYDRAGSSFKRAAR